jgi:transketolase
MSIPCRQAFSEQILELAKSDRSIITLCSDSRGSVTLGQYATELPEQFVEVGIAEQNCIGIAAGLSNAGMKPFVAGPACFYSMRSAEQVKVDVAYSNSNVKIIGISGGVSYGALGTSHHSLQDIATMTSIPGLTVILPSDAWQTKRMTTQLTNHVGPVYVRMGRGAVPDVYGPEGISGLTPEYEIGHAIQLMYGTDVLIVATGETVYHAYLAGKLLAEQNLSATVLDVHTLMPLDENSILEAAANCRAVVTIEEHSVNGGLGALVASLLGENTPRLLKKIAFPNENLVTGSSNEVFCHYGLTAENIAEQAKFLLKRGEMK